MDVWIDSSNRLSAGQHIYFSKREKCYLITKEGSVFVEKLSSNQEEANTKIALHIKHAALTNPGPVVVRSHSGDTDIPVLFIALFADTDQTIYLDNGHGNHRKVLDLESCEMTIPMKKALLGLHAFTGNDYVSAFFKKERKPAGPYCRNTHSSWTFLWNLDLIGSQMNI